MKTIISDLERSTPAVFTVENITAVIASGGGDTYYHVRFVQAANPNEWVDIPFYTCDESHALDLYRELLELLEGVEKSRIVVKRSSERPKEMDRFAEMARSVAESVCLEEEASARGKARPRKPI